MRALLASPAACKWQLPLSAYEHLFHTLLLAIPLFHQLYIYIYVYQYIYIYIYSSPICVCVCVYRRSIARVPSLDAADPTQGSLALASIVCASAICASLHDLCRSGCRCTYGLRLALESKCGGMWCVQQESCRIYIYRYIWLLLLFSYPPDTARDYSCARRRAVIILYLEARFVVDMAILTRMFRIMSERKLRRTCMQCIYTEFSK